ncbi:MAG: autotransporter domain-containing protein [Akkermansiaceae bacterium]|nr:autotransporter domain-containing protein [Akkermansiaceae bacterium]
MDKVEILLCTLCPGRCMKPRNKLLPGLTPGIYLPTFQQHTYMKPHLPVSLLRALVTAAIAFPAFVSGGTADIPSDYTQIIATTTSDVAGSQPKMAFTLKPANLSTVTNPTMTWNPATTLPITPRVDILFTSFDDGNKCSINMSSGGFLMTVGDATFVSLYNVTFDSNNASVKSDNNITGYGGTIISGGMTHDAEGFLEGYEMPDGDVTFRNNRNLSITRSSLSVAAENGTKMVRAYGFGGVIMSPTTVITGNKDIYLEANTLSVKSSSNQASEAYGFGGVIYGSDISITNNEDVYIQGNRLDVTTSGAAGRAGGAALFSNHTVSIEGNTSVTIRNNIVHYKDRTQEHSYLESICIDSEHQGQLKLAAGANTTISLFDPITVDCNVSINANFTNSAGDSEKAVGDVMFSALHAEADLTAFLKGLLGEGNEQPSVDDLLLSRTSLVQGTTTLHSGRMMLCDGARYEGAGFVGLAGSTLYMRSSSMYGILDPDAVIAFGDGRIVFQSGANLYLKSTSSMIDAVETNFAGTNKVTFDISSTNLTASSLFVNGELTFNAGTTLYITSDNQLTEGVYTLLNTTDLNIEGWSSANVTVTSNEDIGFDATYANLRWEIVNNVNTLYYYTSMPPLLDATWTNEDGDFVWSSTAINWEQMGQAYAFSNGATATFTDDGCGTIHLKGTLRPSEVLVDNTLGKDYEWVAHADGGKLAGDMTLTKRGAGKLTISLANEYTGGTFVEDGTLVAGHIQAFGTGDITVKGGSLDLQNLAVTNKVTVNAGSFIGTAYDGILTVTGDATLGDNTTAASINLKAAYIKGGSIVSTNITAEEATIETIIAGTTNLTVNGNTTMRGDHTSTGTFTVNGGTLRVEGSTSADLNLKGGSFVVETPMVLTQGQDVTFNGGNMVGSLETANGSTLKISASSSISEDLTLNGGTVTPGGSGISLKIGGDLIILGNTTIDVNAYVDEGTYVLMSATSISDNLDLLTAVTDTRNENTLDVSGSSLVLKVKENPATLAWDAGAEGIWSTQSEQEWIVVDGGTDPNPDSSFYNRDKVVFDKGGAAEIVGEVKPESISVTGTEDVSFSGSGSIVGDASLVKEGSGTLNMNASNAYLGGTVIKEGTVNAGGKDSFGRAVGEDGKVQLGAIELQGGHLNMGDYAVENDVMASGGKFTGTAYDGELTVKGNISVGDNTTAAAIALKEGSIKDGSLKDTSITTSGDAAIESALKGTTSLTVEDGETILRGKNSSSGDTTVNGGALRIARDEAFGPGNIYLNNGRMIAEDSTTLALSGKQALYFRGGSITGNVGSGNSTAIVLDRNGDIDGNLRLNGGTVYFNGKAAAPAARTAQARSMAVKSNGCTLSVSGSITLTADTLVELEAGQYADGDILMEADSLTGDFGQLVLNYDDGNPNTEYALALKETDGKVQVWLDLDKVYEHTDGKWDISNGDLRDLLVQSNWGMFASSHAFSDAMQGQRSASGVVGSKGVMVWASALYNHMSVNDDGTKNGGDTDTMGAAVGIETMIGSRSCIGLAVGVTSSDISVGNIADEMEQDGTYIGLYGATVLSSNDISGLTLSWSAAYGAVDSSPSGAASSIEWQQDSFQLNGRLDWSRSISDRTTVNVFAGLEYFMTTADEVAGVDSGEISNLRAELGAGITRRYASSVLYAEARLLGDIMRDDPTPTINGWSEEGANPGTVGAGFRVGAAYDINEFWSIGANAGVEIMGDATSAGANVGASLKF